MTRGSDRTIFWLNMAVFGIGMGGYAFCVQQAILDSRWWIVGSFLWAVVLGSLYGAALSRADLYQGLWRELVDAITRELQGGGSPRQGAGDRDL